MNIEDLIKKYEVDRVEFKQELPEKSIKYIKSVVGYANTSGGSIVIGVVEGTHEVIGVPTTDVPLVCDQIANAISDMVTPQLLPNIYVADIEGKNIIVCEVFPSPNRPYYVESLGKEKGAFVRVLGTTRACGSAILKDLELEGANMSYDALAYLEADYDKGVAENLCRVIEKYIFEKEGVEKPVAPEQLENWGLLKRVDKKLVPTNAFMLMTSNPIQFATVQCALFKGTTRSVFIDKREFGGPLYNQIEESYQFVLKHINLGATIEGLFRKEKYELPKESIRELIVNAITHRNYADNASVQVSVFDDRVEITSPGMLYGGVTLQEILNGTSKIRNKVIATVFAEMYIIEKWGTGIQRVIEGCRDYGIADPEWIELGTTFRVNLYRPNDQGQLQGHDPDVDPVNDLDNDLDRAELIIAILKENAHVTYPELAKKLEVSEATIKREIQKLKKASRIKRIGSDRDGSWVVSEENEGQ